MYVIYSFTVIKQNKVQRGGEETGVVCFLDPVLKRTSVVLSHLFSLTVFETTSASKPLACKEEEYSVREIPTLLFVSPNLKRNYEASLTYLQLSLYPSFASFPKGHLRLIVLCHDLHKLPGQNGVLRTSNTHKSRKMC